MKDLSLKITHGRRGGVRLSLDKFEVRQGEQFSTVLFDEGATAEEIAEELPRVLEKFSAEHFVRLTDVQPFSVADRTAFLLRHTVPQTDDQPLM